MYVGGREGGERDEGRGWRNVLRVAGVAVAVGVEQEPEPEGERGVGMFACV